MAALAFRKPLHRPAKSHRRKAAPRLSVGPLFMFYAFNVFAVDVGVSLATIIRQFKPDSAIRHELHLCGKPIGQPISKENLKLSGSGAPKI